MKKPQIAQISQMRIPEPETETIDKLFLELAQFSRAWTGRECRMIHGIVEARNIARELNLELKRNGDSKSARSLGRALEGYLQDLLT